MNEYIKESDHSLENRASLLLQQGKNSEAELLYAELIKRGSKNPIVYTHAAVVCRRAGRLDEAIGLLTYALRLDENLAEASYNLGNALKDLGAADDAIKAYKNALKSRPNFPEALFNLGNLYADKQDIEKAIGCYLKATCLQPHFPAAYLNLGNMLKKQCLSDAAIRCYETGASQDPGNADAWLVLAIAYIDNGDRNKAFSCLQKVLTIRPNYPEALFKLGNLQRETGEVSAAITTYEKAIELNPNLAEAYFNLGIFYRDIVDLERSIAAFTQAITIREEYGEAQRNYALALLLSGRFVEGWEHYEWRREEHQNSKYYQCQSYWLPTSPVHSLLIPGEQGIGDQIMFCSMLHELLPRVEVITLQTDPRLVPLLKRSFPAIELIDTNDEIDPGNYDATIPMGSLGGFFRRGREDFIHARSPYLISDSERSSGIREELNVNDELVIGISWDSMRQDTGPKKSIPLELMASSLSRKGVRLVSLQYGDVREVLDALRQKTGIMVDRVESVDTFYDIDGLASLIDACDLVVTSSNTTVHVSGALGKTTWLLLQQLPDWRWGISDSECLWYSSVTIFRQEREGHWEELMARVKHELSRYVACHALKRQDQEQN